MSENQKWENFAGNINIYSDLEETDISKLIAEEKIHSLQFYKFQSPADKTWKILNDFFYQYPKIGLRVLWYETQDLSFYEKIPNIRRFQIASYNTKDFSKLQSNVNLETFGIEETKSKSADISFIRNFADLNSLYVDGMKKGIENAKYLSNLKTLTFRGIKLDNLDFLISLEKLENLNLLFGSYKNLDSLDQLKQLKTLELSRVRQIPDYSFINSLENLEKLEFEGMSELEKLPNLSSLSKLKRVHINNNLRLRDIESLNEIQSLKLLQISFAENSKSNDRKNLINQAVEIILSSKTIEYTNIMHWTDQKTTEKLLAKGVKNWKWDVII